MNLEDIKKQKIVCPVCRDERREIIEVEEEDMTWHMITHHRGE